jgi:hypothetical protein
MRHCCHPDSVVVLEGDVIVAGLRRGAALHRLDSTARPVFQPDNTLLRQLLGATYFEIESQAWLHAWAVRWAALRARWSSKGLLVDRALTVCRPCEGRNSLHIYPPPFGLAQYDPRPEWQVGTRE